MTIRKLLVANRGEIAVRIIRAAKALGLSTVQVHSTADAGSMAVRMADEAVDIGPPTARKSYLNIDAIISAARATGADAVHPGYGFLAENADFADAVVAAGLVFVGPEGASIRLLGDKAAARREAIAAGVPVVPGSEGVVHDIEDALRVGGGLGYPVMIKAAAGGGGRGIRIAHDAGELTALFPQARAEAEAAFGSGGLYLEKYIARARHVEVQILGDGRDVVHCFDRECSLQRRRQKIWEEAPAACVPADIREELCTSAVRLAQRVGYRGAGTVEYLYDEDARRFYFIEVNTRIQVEHPVTEMVTGIDLIQEMILIAGGEHLRFRQDDISIDGHSIECRINAEDPARDFLPAPGTISRLVVPQSAGVRFDTMLFEGYAVPPFYDSLLGKLIVHAKTRTDALQKLRSALDGLSIEGVATTLPLHASLANDPFVATGDVDTRFLEDWLARSFPKERV